MEPESEMAQVTELHVRMDCQGCVQKIKKAMNDIEGIESVHADMGLQKLTVVRRADPEILMNAIRKTRKIATLCSPIKPLEPSGSEQPQPTELSASSSEPATEVTALADEVKPKEHEVLTEST